MPGPPPKPADQRSRVPRGRAMTMLPPRGDVKQSFPTPDPPRTWLAVTKATWRTFWRSPLAPFVIEAEVDILERLFEMRDMQRRFRREGLKRPIVPGSQGQPVTNPLFDEADRLEPLIQRLEDKFGKTPLARLKLGVAFGDAARSLDDLNRDLTADEEPLVDDEPDTRLLAVSD